MPGLRLDVTNSAQALERYLPFWRAHAPTPLQSPEWLLAWWSAFENANTQLSVLVVSTEADEVVGLAPFYLRNRWTDGRSVRFLGSGRACGDFQTLLAKPGSETLVGNRIGQWLIDSQIQLKWSLIELEGTTHGDPAIAAMVDTLSQEGCLQHLSPLENTWRLDLSQGWQGFMDGLSKTQRRQIRNLVNRFDKSDSWNIRFVKAIDELPAALQQFIALHQKRWTAVGEPGCFADVRFAKFIQLACSALSESGHVSIALVEDEGQAIACQLYVSDATGNKYMYQSGRDPQRDADGVGKILTAVAVRQACQEGAGYIDFLRGDEIYKGRLGAAPTQCLRWRLVAPALLPRVRHSLRTLGRGVKHQVNTLRASWNRSPASNDQLPNTHACETQIEP